ncbi:MAG TPA: hypothetical protein VNF99_15840 [Stellaceae bacterium]|nr:hypothetical protein [Stellaceae bacterium]
MKRIAVMVAILAPVLAGCHHNQAVAGAPDHDARTELRRERDCANPQWKAANLGLWFNLCQVSSF